MLTMGDKGGRGGWGNFDNVSHMGEEWLDPPIFG